jgi:MoaA/NifB/PqqE/SkfB family radical SAM enzyme
MERLAFEAYDKTRNFAGKAVRSLCYAPFTTLYFDTRGDVRVCCHNWKHTVGNILRDNVDDMWRGEKIRELRRALADYTFGPGCDFCYFQTEGGNFANAAMGRFEWFPVPSESPEWPQQMEFSISNACNLECIMCEGQYSSAIRAHREKLPPLPRLYSNEFLESLRKYLPHLRNMKFLGGEPFLVVEYFRLWDMMVEDGHPVRSMVSTNGTQYNRRIEALMDKIPFCFGVSMDGCTRETVETIRAGANYDELIANARRFRDYARQRGTAFSLTFCLMRQNWHEFGDFCLMADEWDCSVYVNTVLKPPQFGIYTMDRGDMRAVLDGMESQVARLDASLRRNRAVWFGELERIREKYRALDAKHDEPKATVGVLRDSDVHPL